jgi:hypothetical protein
MLGAVILRTSEDHEAAIWLREAAPVLGRRLLIFGRLLIAVLVLALARLTRHALEELAVLELMLDGVVVIGAQLFQELLEVVGIALFLPTRLAVATVLGLARRQSFFLFPCPEEGPSSWSSRMALPLAQPSVKTSPIASSPEAWFVAMSRSSRVVRGFRQPSL